MKLKEAVASVFKKQKAKPIGKDAEKIKVRQEAEKIPEGNVKRGGKK